MTYEQAINWIDTSKTRGILPGLERMDVLLTLLGNPQQGRHFFHVAGTNGKGSTCIFLEAILLEAGYTTGLFTSPFLLRPEEMFRVSGEAISKESFAALAETVMYASEAMTATHGLPVSEAMTATHGLPVSEVMTATPGLLTSEAMTATHGLLVSEVMTATPGLLASEAMTATHGLPVSDAMTVTPGLLASEDMIATPGLPSEYEIYTAMAFLLFHESNCSAAILETCMGGLFDATNAYTQKNTAGITAIGWDHMQFLGRTLSEIAHHKAGILKNGGTAVTVPQTPEVAKVLCEIAEKKNADLTVIAADAVKVLDVGVQGTAFTYRNETYRIPLIGEHQAMNAALAIAMVQTTNEMDIAMETVQTGVLKAVWPCRFEVFSGKPTIILDSAHNTEGVASFLKTYRRVFPDQKATVIFGVMKDKDVPAMLQMLSTVAESFVFVQPPMPRAMTLDDLAGIALKTFCNVEKSDTMEKAIKLGLDKALDTGVLVALGSIYYIGQIRELALQNIMKSVLQHN